ncbi:MAG: hypothetical protein LBK29_00825 [Oscillospiraceae bacterium]|jgi:hypothetical protein|nr:hypothetical protein [Oscillospiraceae bacterium]
MINNTNINVSILGSRNSASLVNKKATPYKHDKEIFYYLSGKTYHFYFSGPNLIDVGTQLSINRITEKAKTILCENIEKLKSKKDTTISINIKGHSRGATVASNLWNLIKNKYKNDEKVKMNSLVKADEYAGPINNYIKKNDERTYNESENIICVISLKSRRGFKTPTRSLGSKIVIFTDKDHNATYVISNAAYHQFKNGTLTEGVYFCSESPPRFSRNAKDRAALIKQQTEIHQFKKEAKFEKINDANKEEVFERYAPIADKGRRTDLFFSVLFGGSSGKKHDLTSIDTNKLPENILEIYRKKQSRVYNAKKLFTKYLKKMLDLLKFNKHKKQSY